MNKVLITGGLGFIGSHLAEAHLLAGDQVSIIDDLSTGSFKNVEHLLNSAEYKSRIQVTVDTVLNYQSMYSLIGKVNRVYHLAAAVGVRYILENSLKSIVVNTRGTEITLDICQKFNRDLFFASTSEIYGCQDKAPLVETDNAVIGSTDKARWSYASGKLIDEFMALSYYRERQVPVVVGRFFNTVGPRQTGRYGMVIPRMVQQALEGSDITVYGDGTQSRTFTHVKEAVISIIKLMDNPKTRGQVFNIGGVEEVSISSLAERIKKLTGSKSKIVRIPYEEVFDEGFADMPRRVPCTNKLFNWTEYRPELKLDAILENIIDYFKDLAPAQAKKAA